MAETVSAPDGRKWIVRRRWLPRLGHESLSARFLRRVRRPLRRAEDGADLDPGGFFDALGEGIVAAVAVVLFAVALVYVVIPLLVALLDLLILILVALLGALTRVLFRRPWTVEARAGDGTTMRWRVTGWRASHERCIEVAQRLEAGIEPDLSPGVAPWPP